MKLKTYTQEDVKPLESGEYQLVYERPEDGQSYRLQGCCVDSLVSRANQMNYQYFEQEISLKPYAEGVFKLAQIALNPANHSAEVAAQLLLSAYNSSYLLSVADLCQLDDENYALAMAVINGRAKTNKKPHQVIKDGESIFNQLVEVWPSLHIDNRWRDPCPTCNGSGTEEIYDEEIGELLQGNVCPNCEGTGYCDYVPLVFGHDYRKANNESL